MRTEESLLVGTRFLLGEVVHEAEKALGVIQDVSNRELRARMARALHTPLNELKDALVQGTELLEPGVSVIQSLDEIAAELRELM
jgi:hypothetical protein